MTRWMVLALALCCAYPAQANTQIVVNFPPPPVVAFQAAPDWELVPGTQVYIVAGYDRPDYDMFRYGGWYYICDEGYWYRAPRWNGRFVGVSAERVPVVFTRVPHEEWRVWPSTWMAGRHVVYTRNGERGNGWHGRHRGRGHAYGRDD